ncbi:hypothetical protein Tco_1031122 [Tanacetum coccineum]|uniref:Uncharacterized protein n=1 Tax=Tanacetum coccineum TaxID=301880 RepID=A0ABQ5G839_9ASTR
MDRSFTLGSTEEAEMVEDLQSCNRDRKWSLCSDRFNYFSFDHFDSAIYWNDGLHWLETENRQLMHYSLNIEDPDHPIITTITKFIPQRNDFPQVLWLYGSNANTHTNGVYYLRDEVWVFIVGWLGVQYNLISNNVFEIYDCGSNQVDDNHDDNDDANDDELLLQISAKRT